LYKYPTAEQTKNDTVPFFMEEIYGAPSMMGKAAVGNTTVACAAELKAGKPS